MEKDINAHIANEERQRRTLWRNEYTMLKGIHLEYTEETPPCVELFKEVLASGPSQKNISTIIDIGCGKGRVGLHLAKEGFFVTGFDFVPSVLEEFAAISLHHKLDDKVRLFSQEINEGWHCDDASFDAAFAITVIDNLTTEANALHFKKELLRIVKPHGFFIIEFYVKEDGYYGPLLDVSGLRSNGILADPYNGIMFKIYTPDEIHSLFDTEFLTLRELTLSWKSSKYGKAYERKSQLIIFQRR